MVVKRETVITRLENLDRIVSELNQYAGLTYSQYSAELRHQWVIERGLIAAAGVILDIAEHILVAHFGEYSGTYEKSLAAIHQRSVISAQTYQHLRGLGGFRNILVHLYHEIDPTQVWEHYHKALTIFPAFGREILTWLGSIDTPTDN
jgi:uncharacterized protein YutE (UPF0331/DUF86 family)